MATETIIYLAFVLAALLPVRVPPPIAVPLIYLGGLVLLPVGVYPDFVERGFPHWIVGSAVPSDMLFAKSWVAPIAALARMVVYDFQTVRRFAVRPIDLPIALFCLWPLAQMTAGLAVRPAPFLAALYLLGCWGAPWLLGRICFGSGERQRLFLQALVAAGLVLLPVALIEGVAGPRLYATLYGPHPFEFIGALRDVGFRPLGFFEDGTQYAMWIATAALAAIWLAASAPAGRARAWCAAAAALLVAMTLAAQSAAAILLLVGGVSMLALDRIVRSKWVLGAALAGLAVAGPIYVSGIVPVRSIAENSSAGRAVVAAFREAGRGSFPWRIAQDQKVLPLIARRPVTGSGQWDWWLPARTRPWSLALLMLGQFGAIGLLLAFGALLGPAVAALAAPRPAGAWREDAVAVPLAVLVVLAFAEALLNAFFFLPAIAAAGALAASRASRRESRGSPGSRLRAAPTE